MIRFSFPVKQPILKRFSSRLKISVLRTPEQIEIAAAEIERLLQLHRVLDEGEGSFDNGLAVV